MTEPSDPQQSSAADDFLRDMDQQISEIRARHDARLLTDSADPADVSARLREMFELDQYARHRVDAAHDAGAQGDELRELQSEVSAHITAVDAEYTREVKGFVHSHGWLKLFIKLCR